MDNQQKLSFNYQQMPTIKQAICTFHYFMYAKCTENHNQMLELFHLMMPRGWLFKANDVVS